jgi:CubicO group peptidase (beta-lactamase class C family)
MFATVTQADSIDRYLETEMANNHIPGLALAVIRNGKVIKLQTYGDANLEWGTMVGPDTEFQLASTTKILTGTALMTLVERGKIRLDDPVSKYLPDAPPAWKDVTVRNLATHTSGIPEAGGLDTTSLSTVAEIVAAAGKLPLRHAPGTESGYGSADFVVLSRILETVFGKSYPDLLAELFFEPVKMKSSGFDSAVIIGPIRSSDLIRHRAGVYLWREGKQRVHSFHFPFNAYSAGGLYSSVGDLARWISALDRGEILDSQTQAQMWSPYRLKNGEQTPWAIGWVARTYEGRKTAGHSGGPALSDLLRFVDEKLTIIVLQNQQRMYPYLAQGVADLYLTPHPPVTAALRPDPNPRQSALVKAFLMGLAQGSIDESLFAPGHGELVDDVRSLLVPFSHWLGPIDGFKAVTRVEIPGSVEWTYAATYGKKVVDWIFDFDASGKITGMNETTP